MCYFSFCLDDQLTVPLGSGDSAMTEFSLEYRLERGSTELCGIADSTLHALGAAYPPGEYP